METERIVSAWKRPDDWDVERSLRPRNLAEYIGQDKVKEHLRLFITAAKQRDEALDHVLLYGPPGLNQFGSHYCWWMGGITTQVLPSSVRSIAILTSLYQMYSYRRFMPEQAGRGGTYPAMEDGAVDIVIGGVLARSVRTICLLYLGGGHHQADATSPLRDRFGMLSAWTFMRLRSQHRPEGC